MEVGFIGTGWMGNAMAHRILGAGHALTVNDLHRERTTNLCEAGARWAESPRAVAEASEVVLLSLPGPAEVEAVVLDPATGVVAGLRAGCTLIDCTTSHPDMSHKVARACQERGAAALDAPVSAAAGRAAEGGLTFMIGGDAAVVEQCRPLLECMGKHIFHMGPVGAGVTTKLVTQYMGYTNWVTAAEGMLMAAKAGIDLRMLAQVAPNTPANSRMLGSFERTVFDRNFGTPETATAQTDIIAKDMKLAVDAAHALGVPCATGEIAAAFYRRAQEQGLGRYNYWTAIKLLEEPAGTELNVLKPG